MKSKSRALKILVLLTLAFLTVAYVLPVYVVVVTSLKTPAEISARRYLIPSTDLQIENFVTSFELILPSLLNSAIIGFSAVSYTHLRAHETVLDLVCRLLLEKKNIPNPHHHTKVYRPLNLPIVTP